MKGVNGLAMSIKSKTVGRTPASAAAFVVLGAVFAIPVHADIVRIVVDWRTPLDAIGSSGAEIGYEEIRGRLFGEIDPGRPENTIIQDLDAAPRNSRGKVEYISTFTLHCPVSATHDSGRLLALIPNRGDRFMASLRKQDRSWRL